ncbi:MAG: NAD-dependent epimerase/dehydratase family protein [bacterium]
MKILITGICGFAGSIIARGLLEHLPGVRITGIDSLIRRGSETNLEPLRALGIDVRVGDIRNQDDIDSLPPADWVLDCAANPSVLAGVDGQTSAKELLDHNLGGTIHLLEYCRKNKAGFILLSTSRVYSIPPLASLPVEIVNNAFRPVLEMGNWPQNAQNAQNGLQSESLVNPVPLVAKTSLSSAGVTESFSTEPPISLYGSSKKCSELLALEYGLTFDFPVRINRCGVLAGAGQFGKADQGIFSFWIHSWARRRPLRYIGFDGMGHQVRDCLHPRDIVPLLISQMGDAGRSVEPILNVSGGASSAMSLAQLSAWCAERLGSHQVASDSNPRPFDIPWMVLDSSEVQKAWGWNPVTTTDDILEEIAQHSEQNSKWLELVS